jgi:peptidoglycan DL-endopeptidase CwlO
VRAPLRRVWGLRTRRTARTGLVICLALGCLSAMASVAVADPDPDPDPGPSQAQVDAAKKATVTTARDVARVQADLVLADQRVQAAQVHAAKVAEAYNGAIWKLHQARQAVHAAERREADSAASLARQKQAYGAAIASSYEMAPELTAMSAMLRADGPAGLMERYTALDSAQSAISNTYAEYSAASTLAGVATSQADQARAAAARLARTANAARAAARAAEAAATAEASAVSHQRDQLIGELARVQDISVKLAGRRQQALEDAAAQAAAAAAQQAAEDAAPDDSKEPPADNSANQPSPSPQPSPQPTPQSTPEPEPAPESAPTPDPTPPSPSSSGARAAIAFARAQLGEPYVWGAAGPDSWDCSGVVLGAWRAGGKYLPHYSVAQYEQSTPISRGALRPGDLVFWGDSASPSSIYHVALYVGNGMIIHAPRPGRGVELVSMYYWITPNFYARP